MKRMIIMLAALAIGAFAASAQDREIDLESLDDFNSIELSKAGSRVETSLDYCFPMYFGASALVGTNYKGEWSAFAPTKFLDMKTAKNFVYGLQLADLHLKYNALDVSLGLRWTFMDFTFANSDYTLRAAGNVCVPKLITLESQYYDGKKSKIHASYFGIPLKVGLNYGKAKFYVGASAEMLTGGYTKYKRPKYREKVNNVFNPFRATVEGGFSYGGLGAFVMYGLTPLFQESLSDAHTVTFGVVFGL